MAENSKHMVDVGRINTKYFTAPTEVKNIKHNVRGILAEVDAELLRIDVIRDDILRIKLSKGGVFDEAPTFAVCADLSSDVPCFEVEVGEKGVKICTSKMVLTLELSPFRLDVQRTDGSFIFETGLNQDGIPEFYASLNNEFVIRKHCMREDAFYGLGEKTGRLNRKGQDFTLWNTDVLNPTATGEFKAKHAVGDPRADQTSTEFDPYYVSIPFFYHMMADNQAAGFFVDNGYRARFDFSPHTAYSYHFLGGQYTEYIFAGPSMADILEGYTWLTGRMQPPPLWALGYHQCRWHAYNQETLEALAIKQRQAHIPCDALWLDIDYMDGYRVFTWNTENFPDVPGMLNRLGSQGFKAITIIDPGVKYDPGYQVYDQAIERDILCKTESGTTFIGQVWPGKTAFPDFVTQAGRDWWGELNAQHVKSGLAGIWNDMNEPATGEVPPDAMRFGNGLYSHARYHNQYALLMAMGTTDGLLAAMPDKRTFVLSRAGFAGIQRYAANWLGDNLSRWDHLWMSLPMGMGLGISGQPFIGADIGGFNGNSNAELFSRWVQCGALVPFCRNHNSTGNIDQYAWSFGEVVEAVARQAIELRYRLMPYIYSCFIQAAETGAPVQQPLIFAFQDDKTLRDIDDQYLFGPNLLVAPVTAPGITSRQVYLPDGNWFNWHGEHGNEAQDGQVGLQGKRFIIAPTPMDGIPLYARGGAVIPMWPEAPASTAGFYPSSIELHIFVPTMDGVTESMLQEDDGLTFGFRHGAFYRTTFSLKRAENVLSLEGIVSGNGFAEFARRSFTLIFHGSSPTQIEVNGQSVKLQAGRVDIPNNGVGLRVEVKLSAS